MNPTLPSEKLDPITQTAGWTWNLFPKLSIYGEHETHPYLEDLVHPLAATPSREGILFIHLTISRIINKIAPGNKYIKPTVTKDGRGS